MKVVFKSYNTVLVAQAAAERLKTDLSEDCLEWKLELPPKAGEGCLLAYDFENSIQLLLLQAKLAEDCQIHFQAPEPSPLLLLFSVRGKKECQLDGDHYELNPLQTVVAANPADIPLTLTFKAGEDTLFLIQFIARKNYKTLVGYDNAGYFARRFREKYGILPSEFLSALEEVDEV